MCLFKNYLYYFNSTITGRSLSFSNKGCTFHNVNFRILPKLLSVFHTFKINDKINFIPVSIHLIKLLQIYVQSRDKLVGNIKVSLFVNFSFYFWSPCGQIDTHFVEIYIPQNTQNHRNGRAVLFLSCCSV